MSLHHDHHDYPLVHSKPFLAKATSVRIVTCITCCLSILGSILIILTFVFFRKLRTKARQILVHLSIMDMGIAISNLVGASIYFDKYYYAYEGNLTIWLHPSHFHDSLCKTQAFFAMYSTYGSIFWTNCLAIYLYFTIVHHNARINKLIVGISCVVCYLLPLGLCLWLVMSHRLGFSPYGSGGWCTLISVHPITKVKDIFAVSFGYDMWIYMTFILIPVLFIGTRAHINIQLSKTKDYISKAKLWIAVHNVDYKFVLIPITFIFLRIWTCIICMTGVYTNIIYPANPHLINALIHLAAIGDSGQGIANAIIFVFCTKKVRDKLCFYCNRRNSELDPINAHKEYDNVENNYYSIKTPSPSVSPSPSPIQTFADN